MSPPLSRRLYRPRPVRVRRGAGRTPVAVGSRAVEQVLEDWLVEDRWWTESPVRRHYYEVLLETGATKVVFIDLAARRWLEQPGG